MPTYPSTSALVTALGYALLCEIRKEPRGGYALRRLFETTPLGHFSSSPGSIYPALKRLENLGLIQAVGTSRSHRFEITQSGEESRQAWLAEPVTLADVSGRVDLCLLRFAFLQDHADPTISTAFLVSLASAAREREEELQAFLDGETGQALSLHGRLAVEHGIRSIAATGHWAKDALAKLTAQVSGDLK